MEQKPITNSDGSITYITVKNPRILCGNCGADQGNQPNCCIEKLYEDIKGLRIVNIELQKQIESLKLDLEHIYPTKIPFTGE